MTHIFIIGFNESLDYKFVYKSFTDSFTNLVQIKPCGLFKSLEIDLVKEKTSSKEEEN